MSGNGHGGSRTLAEKRFPSTVRKSNITRRRAVRSPFRWSFFNPAIDVKLFKSRFPLNCRGFRFDRTSLQIFEITPRFMHDFPFSLSLSLSLSLPLSRRYQTWLVSARDPIVFSTNPFLEATPPSHRSFDTASLSTVYGTSPIFSTIELPGVGGTCAESRYEITGI